MGGGDGLQEVLKAQEEEAVNMSEGVKGSSNR
jgi:hypothetical protein